MPRPKLDIANTQHSLQQNEFAGIVAFDHMTNDLQQIAKAKRIQRPDGGVRFSPHQKVDWQHKSDRQADPMHRAIGWVQVSFNVILPEPPHGADQFAGDGLTMCNAPAFRCFAFSMEAESCVVSSYDVVMHGDRWQQFWESYLSLPSVEPGQVARWSWVARTPWPSDWPTSWVVVLLVCLAAFVVEVYRRDSRSLRWLPLGTLVVLRSLTWLLVLAVLSQFGISIERSGLPLIVVLLDDSASMSLRDSYRATPDRKFAAELIGSDSNVDVERWMLAREIVARNEGAWLRRLRGRYRIQVERFSSEAIAIGRELLSDEDVRSTLSALEQVKPVGTATRPAEAVRQVLQRTRGASPTAIVILTDGIASSGDQDKLSAIATLAREQLVPLFVVGIGSDETTRDVQFVELVADETAFVNDPILFAAKLKSFGFAGQSAMVELRERGSDKILASSTVTLPADGESKSFELIHTPTQSGDREFELRIVPPAGDVDPANNRRTQTIRVREGKLRILLADGLPRWEFRELKNTLEREPTLELHTLLQESDVEFALQDETAKPLQGRFPVTLEALKTYDVMLLGDLSPSLFSAGVLEHVREFVRSGGGLLLMSGPYHMPLEFRGTPLETLLPIELEGTHVPAADANLSQPFHPQWTVAGRQSTPLFRHLQAEDTARSDRSPQDVWKALPEMFWLCEASQLKAGATVLLEDPLRRGQQHPLPVIALQRFGAGRVLFHATDELWRWRFRGGERFYARFWVQTLRFLARPQSLDGGRGIEFSSDRQVYQQGEPVQLRLQFLNESLMPANQRASVMVERTQEPRRTIELSPVDRTTNTLTGEIRGLRNGQYHALVLEPSQPGTTLSLDFQIETPQREMLRRRLDRADLELAARTTHGKYFALHEADFVHQELPAGQPVPTEVATVVPLWSRWELLLLAIGLLTAEWLCRRHWKLV